MHSSIINYMRIKWKVNTVLQASTNMKMALASVKVRR